MRKALLEERVHHRVPCTILEVGRACVGGAAHLALMEMSVLLAVVGIAHVVHLIDGLACVLRKVFDGILIAEVVPAFDRVKRVRLDAVLVVRDSCDTVHAALCHRRCRARWH